MSVLNEPALRSVVAMIELHPELWDQGALARWSPAGLVHCLAAWTCRLAGQDVRTMLQVDPSGDLVYFTARELLGLTAAQADRLFLHHVHEDGPHPSVDDLKTLVGSVTGVTFKG